VPGMRARGPMSDREVRRAVQLYEEGYSLGSIGRALERHGETIRQRLLAAGVQMRHRSVLLTVWGETKCVAEWARDPRCPVNEDTLRQRVSAGWDPQRAVQQPWGIRCVLDARAAAAAAAAEFVDDD